MITTALMGGLGNQMFQYAYARSLALDYETYVSFDISFFEQRKDRDLSLLKMRLTPSIVFNRLPAGELYQGFFLDKISRKKAAAALLKKQFLFWPTMQPYPFDFELNGDKDIKLYGYWQGERLFKHHRKEIANELRVLSDVSEQDQILIDTMRKENSVCVHIRRGDYVGLDWLVCDKQYYEKGTALMAEKLDNPSFYIFSDDISWAKENIHFPENCKIVFADDGKHKDYEILRLMYSCNNFVISNSTFSWWGQWLSYNENKIVVAPKVWFKDNKNYDFMYSDDWIRLG